MTRGPYLSLSHVLYPYFVYASGEDSDETVRMRRLVCFLATRRCDKYKCTNIQCADLFEFDHFWFMWIKWPLWNKMDISEENFVFKLTQSLAYVEVSENA